MCKILNLRFPREKAYSRILYDAIHGKDSAAKGSTSPQIPVLKLDLTVPGSDEMRNNWHCHLNLSPKNLAELGLDIATLTNVIIYTQVSISYPWAFHTYSNQIVLGKLSKDRVRLHGPNQIKLRIENSPNSCSYLSIDSTNIKDGERIGFTFQKCFEMPPHSGIFIPFTDHFVKDQNAKGALTEFEYEIYSKEREHFFGKKVGPHQSRDHKDLVFDYRVDPKDNRILEFEEVRSLKSNVERKICTEESGTFEKLTY